MKWKNFALAILLGVAIAVALVLALDRWPNMAESPWVMLGLFLFAILVSRVMRWIIRK